jgi:hypothetical protein
MADFGNIEGENVNIYVYQIFLGAEIPLKPNKRKNQAFYKRRWFKVFLKIMRKLISIALIFKHHFQDWL